MLPSIPEYLVSTKTNKKNPNQTNKPTLREFFLPCNSLTELGVKWENRQYRQCNYSASSCLPRRGQEIRHYPSTVPASHFPNTQALCLLAQCKSYIPHTAPREERTLTENEKGKIQIKTRWRFTLDSCSPKEHSVPLAQGGTFLLKSNLNYVWKISCTNSHSLY